jgi:5-methylcytosine-specific restriction endonuclease McrA
MQYEPRLDHVSDDDLLRRLVSLLGDSRRTECELVAHIGEADSRRLYAREASRSMFAYCTEVLHLSEAEAYLRITAARAAREYPVILDMLGDGRLHLSGIAKLVPHLTRENAASLLSRAAYRSKRQVEELVAEVAPRPDVPTLVRKLPERPPRGLSIAPEGVSAAASQAGVAPLLRPDGVGSSITSTVAPLIEPLASARYKVQFTASAELREKLSRLQRLVGPQADLAAVIEQAVTEKLERLERRRFAVTKTPRKPPAGERVERRHIPAPSRQHSAPSRHIPAAVRRAVYARDSGRCRYVDDQGRRCTETHRLEYHHGRPYGLGGDHGLRNVCLMCPAHNQYEAERDYGRAAMSRHRSSGVAAKRGSA